MITGLQTMPSIAWFPLAIVLFQLSEGAITFVVVLGAAPSIANGLISGVDHVPPILRRAGRAMGAGRWATFRHVVLPASMPSFVGGLKQGWSFAWRSLMAGELLVTLGVFSVGLLLTQYRAIADYPAMIAIMIVILVVGIIVDGVLFATPRPLGPPAPRPDRRLTHAARRSGHVSGGETSQGYSYFAAETPPRSADTRMPSGSVPQYPTRVPMLPRNSISSHVAGNVATRKMTTKAMAMRITVLIIAAPTSADVDTPSVSSWRRRGGQGSDDGGIPARRGERPDASLDVPAEEPAADAVGDRLQPPGPARERVAPRRQRARRAHLAERPTAGHALEEPRALDHAHADLRRWLERDVLRHHVQAVARVVDVRTPRPAAVAPSSRCCSRTNGSQR